MGRSWRSPSTMMSTFSLKNATRPATLTLSGSGVGYDHGKVLERLAPGLDGPVPGEALVRAARGRVGRRQQVEPDVDLGQVVARREAGLEEERRLMGVGDRDAVHLDLHVTRAVQDVDPRVRVVGVDEDLLVLLEPAVHRVPVEADQAAQLFDRRLRVVPRGVLGLPVAALDREVLGLAPARRVPRTAVRRQELRADVLSGK